MRMETLGKIMVGAAILILGTNSANAQDPQLDAASAARLAELESRFNRLESRVSRLPSTSVSHRSGLESAESVLDDGAESPCGCGAGSNSGDCKKCGNCFVWGEHTWLKVGAGLRTSYSTVENGAPNGTSWSNNFNIDNARLYFNGQGHEYIKFEFNTDINNAQGFPSTPGSYDEAGNMRILDAVVKFELHDLFNVWMGRLLPPSDRSNLSGPFYANVWDFPFTQFGYPNIFQGRDDGVAIWGQWCGGALKYQVGAFEGVNGAASETQPVAGANPGDDLMFAARVTANLLDPEPGYYNSSTYYGEKDILAIGVAVMNQNNANNDGGTLSDFTGWSIDGLYERPTGNGGVVTVEGAYYDFNDHGATNSVRDGQSYFVLASYLLPGETCIGPISGRFQPFSRYQSYDRTNFTGGNQIRQTDVGVHYIMYGHNARVSAFWARQDLANGTDIDLFRLGVQLQF